MPGSLDPVRRVFRCSVAGILHLVPFLICVKSILLHASLGSALGTMVPMRQPADKPTTMLSWIPGPSRNHFLGIVGLCQILGGSRFRWLLKGHGAEPSTQ